MIVIATLLFLYWLLMHALFYWATAHWLNVYVTALLAFLYIPSYLDGKEYTGERQWRALREWRGWARISPVVFHFANKKDLDAVDYRSMRLYVMIHGKTLNGLIWGMGLHGGLLSPFAERLHFVAPPLLFAIPLLRDVLLWMGAVTWHSKRLPLTDLILQLLRSNRSVCYCPSSFLAGSSVKDEAEIDLALFQFAIEEKIQMVPVLLQNESRYYHIFQWNRVHAWMQARLGYPLPQMYWPRRNSLTSPVPRLQQVFGPILHCTDRYSNATALGKAFCEGLQQLSCPDVGEEEVRVQVLDKEQSF